jgi:hypothetical protein
LWLVAAVVVCACATPSAEGRLVERTLPAAPSRWPSPVPVGTGGGVDITEGALTDDEARALGRSCTDAVALEVGTRRSVKAGVTQGYRVVASRVVVDVGVGSRRERLVRARSVVEVRDGNRSLASATGLATLVARRPTLRAGGVEWREADQTVRAACQAAVRALLAPPPSLSSQERTRVHHALQGPEAQGRVEAARTLGLALDEPSAPALLAALDDAHADVRRLAAWSLGQLAHAPAAERLAYLTETDPDFAVRTEAHQATRRILLARPDLKDLVLEARARGQASRRAAQAAATPATPVEEEGPSRVVGEAGDPAPPDR